MLRHLGMIPNTYLLRNVWVAYVVPCRLLCRTFQKKNLRRTPSKRSNVYIILLLHGPANLLGRESPWAHAAISELALTRTCASQVQNHPAAFSVSNFFFGRLHQNEEHCCLIRFISLADLFHEWVDLFLLACLP